MNYQQTLSYLYNSLPMYQRIGAAAYKANLDNTIAICDLLNNPEDHLTCIHVAGTNGKGSVSHMLASIFQAAGYKTGLYTSPHLIDFRERIRVNGKMIGRRYVSNFVTKYKADFERIQPSFFEMTVGLTFQYFVDQKVDVAIIETGLGGRLDSTNVIQPVLSVITNIDWDHMNLLGNTLQKIAGEKAGIIKKKIPVVIGEADKITAPVFSNKAKTLKSKIYFASEILTASLADNKKINTPLTINQFRKNNGHLKVNISDQKKVIYKNVDLDLSGFYQLKNVVTVLQSVRLLVSEFNIREKHLRKGLSSVRKTTGLAGRWEVISKYPLTIADTGHNQAGIKEAMEMLRSIKYEKLHFVIGMVNDKDPSKILSLLPPDASYYFCKAAIPRGLDAYILAGEAAKLGLKGKVFRSVKSALSKAKTNAGKNDLIFVGGSTFIVAEALDFNR